MMQASREPIAIDFVYKQNSLIYDALESRGPDGRYGAATAEQRRNVGAATAGRKVWQEQYRPAAKIPFLEDNPYSDAKFKLGRFLFFDPILSGSQSRSCAKLP